MAIDHFKFLGDLIRGTICDYDIPALPVAVDESGEAIESSREELELFFRLLADVQVGLGETRPSVLRQTAKLRAEYLGPDAA